MFAPPPLSKADVEKLRAAKLARQATKNAESRDSSPTPEIRRESSSSSVHRADTQSPRGSVKSGFSIFSRNSKQRFSKPISPPVPEIPRSPEQTTPKERKVSFSESTKTVTPVVALATSSGASVPAFSCSEKPRRAPAPPKRPQRVEDVVPTTPPRVRGSSIAQSPPASRPPPVPDKSSRVPSVGLRKGQQPTRDSVTATLEESNIKDASANKGEGPSHPSRAPTAPLASAGKGAVSNARSRRSMVDPNKRLSGVRGGNVEKGHSRQSSGTASIRSTFDELDGLQGKLPRRATDGQATPTKTSPTSSPTDTQLPWKRKKKGETMSMLLESGFFEKEQLFLQSTGAGDDVRVKMPPPLFSLPATPGSAAGTPTEVYQNKRASMNARKRMSSRSKRSPLAQISTTSHKANAKVGAKGGSPSDLHAIPELTRGIENASPSSEVPTPTATQIHVRDGSIVTVVPPELTAYQRHVYLQGPIRLSKPTIAPKKNSVASLEAFQEAVDRVYQESLVIPRRRSDDAVVDDVCDWLESFGFDPVGFDGDLIMADLTFDEINELAEREEDVGSPTEIITPVEARLAKEVVSRPTIPPISTEETLRAKGKKVHESHDSADSPGSRKESATLVDEASIMSVTSPRPESFGPDTLMALAPAVPDAETGRQQNASSFDWDDAPDEMEGGASWTAPAVVGKIRRFLH